MAARASNRAIVIQSEGKAIIEHVPIPLLRTNYLLIRTTAVALDPTDWKHIEYGLGAPGAKVSCDCAGIVVGVGPDMAKSFRKGDRVAGLTQGSWVSSPALVLCNY